MDISFFVWEFPPRLVGGLGTYSEGITNELKKLQNDVTVYTLNDGDLKTEEEFRGIKVVRPRLVDSSSTFHLFASDELKGWGKEIKFLSDVYTYNLLSAAAFNERHKGRNAFGVIAVHDWLSSVAGLSIKQDRPKQPLVLHIHSIEEQRSGGNGSPTIKALEREVANHADKIITVSNSMKECLVSLGYPGEKINVVHNGIDTKTYDPSNVDKKLVTELKEKYGITDHEKTILFIGRLTRVKGVYNLIEAFPKVLKEHPEAKLVILGKGEEQDRIIGRSKELGISEKVVVRSEWVSTKERIAHYALSDVCVFPSLSEPFGIVSLEGMAMEKPVVVGASGVSGMKEQVIPSGKDQTGVHIDGGNPESISWGINQALANPDESIKWGKNGRKRTSKEFSWKQAAQKTIRIYRELT